MNRALSKLGMVIAFISLVISIIVFQFLPDFPTLYGGADKWSGSGIMAVFALPVVSLVISISLYCVIPRLQRAKGETDQPSDERKDLELLVPIVAILFLIMIIVFLAIILTNS